MILQAVGNGQQRQGWLQTERNEVYCGVSLTLTYSLYYIMGVS